LTLPSLPMTPTGEVERSRELALPHFPEIVPSLVGFFASRGIEAYLVGGAVRDALLGRDTRDVDVAVNTDTGDVGSDLASFLGGYVFPLDVEKGIHRVVSGEAVVDLSSLAGDIHEDLGRRDFAVDAMAVSVSDLAERAAGARVIDPHGGLSDLEAGEIRMISSSVFAEDAGRLMRAARLEAQLGFTLSRDTEATVRQQAGMAGSTSGERVRNELLSILAEPGATASLRRLDDLGLLSVVLPELDEARDVTQPKEHHWDVFGHSMETPGQVEVLLASEKEPDGFVARTTPRFEGMNEYFAEVVTDGHSRFTLLKLAALLHDVGKPAAKTVEPSGRIRFIGHHSVGAEIAEGALGRLRLSGRGINMVSRMVRHHLRPGQMEHGDDLPSQKATYRYYRDLADVAIDTVYLNLADYAAARGPQLGDEEWAGRCRTAAHILQAGTAQAQQEAARSLVDGQDIMKALSLEPGPIIGTMLEAVREARATGEVGSREEALDLVRERLKTGGAGA